MHLPTPLSSTNAPMLINQPQSCTQTKQFNNAKRTMQSPLPDSILSVREVQYIMKHVFFDLPDPKCTLSSLCIKPL